LEEEGSEEAGGATGVASSNVLIGFGVRFCNSGKAGQRLAGCLRVVHIAHGGGMHEVGGGRGSFFFRVLCWVMVLPLWCVAWFPVAVLMSQTI
jgi:hypothetical protein